MSALASRLTDLAFDMGLSFPETVALPTVVQTFARKAMMSDAAMVVELENNSALRDYARTLCAKGAEAL